FGFYYHLVLQRAGVNSYPDFIKKIRSANLTNNGIRLCLDGTMVGNKSSSFGLTIPVNKFSENYISGADDEIYFSEFDKNSMELSRNYLHSDCANDLDVSSISLPIIMVEVKANYSIGVNESVEKIIEKNTFDFAIYEVAIEGSANKKVSKRILLVSKNPIFGSSKYFFVKVLDEKKRGGVQWYGVLPFAVLVDAASFPYQAYKWLIY